MEAGLRPVVSDCCLSHSTGTVNLHGQICSFYIEYMYLGIYTCINHLSVLYKFKDCNDLLTFSTVVGLML